MVQTYKKLLPRLVAEYEDKVKQAVYEFARERQYPRVQKAGHHKDVSAAAEELARRAMRLVMELVDEKLMKPLESSFAQCVSSATALRRRDPAEPPAENLSSLVTLEPKC